MNTIKPNAGPRPRSTCLRVRDSMRLFAKHRQQRGDNLHLYATLLCAVLFLSLGFVMVFVRKDSESGPKENTADGFQVAVYVNSPSNLTISAAWRFSLDGQKLKKGLMLGLPVKGSYKSAKYEVERVILDSTELVLSSMPHPGVFLYSVTNEESLGRKVHTMSLVVRVAGINEKGGTISYPLVDSKDLAFGDFVVSVFYQNGRLYPDESPWLALYDAKTDLYADKLPRGRRVPLAAQAQSGLNGSGPSIMGLSLAEPLKLDGSSKVLLNIPLKVR